MDRANDGGGACGVAAGAEIIGSAAISGGRGGDGDYVDDRGRHRRVYAVNVGSIFSCRTLVDAAATTWNCEDG